MVLQRNGNDETFSIYTHPGVGGEACEQGEWRRMEGGVKEQGLRVREGERGEKIKGRTSTCTLSRSAFCMS
jgi:hypothetical protein